MSDERVRVLALLKRHIWNATSFQILEDGFRYWFDGEDACVAYVDTGHAWVAAGAPVAAPERLPVVAEAFARAGAARGRRVSFFAAEARFVPAPGLERLLIGEQPVWNPAAWTSIVEGSRTLREQLRRARAQGRGGPRHGPRRGRRSAALRDRASHCPLARADYDDEGNVREVRDWGDEQVAADDLIYRLHYYKEAGSHITRVDQVDAIRADNGQTLRTRKATFDPDRGTIATLTNVVTGGTVPLTGTPGTPYNQAASTISFTHDALR